jgi:glycosyltransferase involved in cell wall biosynthesis
MPLWLDIFITIFIYSFKSLFIKSDIAIGIKPYPNSGIALLIQKLKGAKVVIDIDDIDYGYRKGIISKFIKLIQSPFPKIANIITYHNDELLKLIVKEFKVSLDKTYKLEQGVFFDVFKPSLLEEEKNKIKKDLGIGNKKILLYTGYLNIASNLEEIIEAFSKIINNDVVLIIAGSGPYEKKYKKLAQKLNVLNKIIFTGYISNQEVAKYIEIADVCLVYYRDEKVNFHRASMKIREYLSFGKPVICNNVGELKRFYNYTYQTDSSVEAFVNEIKKFLATNGDKREEKAPIFIKENFDWYKIAEKFNDALLKIK